MEANICRVGAHWGETFVRKWWKVDSGTVRVSSCATSCVVYRNLFLINPHNKDLQAVWQTFESGWHFTGE